MPNVRQAASSGSKAEWSTDGTTYTEIPDVRVWGLNPATEAKEYRSSSTGGRKKRLGSDDDASGTMSLYIDPTNRFDTDLGIKAGANGYLKLYENADSDFFIVPVIIDDVDYESDIEGDEIQGAEINFSSDGAITYPGE